jgi:hypothetical protein
MKTMPKPTPQQEVLAILERVRRNKMHVEAALIAITAVFVRIRQEEPREASPR